MLEPRNRNNVLEMRGKRAFKYCLLKMAVVEEKCPKVSSRMSTGGNRRGKKKSEENHRRTCGSD